MGRTVYKPKPKIKVDPPAPRVKWLDAFAALWGITSGASRPARLLLGAAKTSGLDTIALKHMGFADTLGEFVYRYQVYLLSDGDEYAKRLLRRTGKKLAAQADVIGGTAAKEAVGEIDDVLRRAGVKRIGKGKTPKVASTLFDRLRETSRGMTELNDARIAFENAIASGNDVKIREAADELKRVLRKRLVIAGQSPADAQALTTRIDKVVNSIAPEPDNIDADELLLHIIDHMHTLDPSDPARKTYKRIIQMASSDRDAWASVARAIAAARKTAPGDDIARASVWRVKGALGEVLAKAHPVYRQRLYESIQRAHRFIARSKGAWEIRIARVEVRLMTKNGKAMALAYDDAVFVVSKSGEPRKAAPVFVAQIKSGDYSSSKVVKQVNSDVLRELQGRVRIDGLECDLVAPVTPVKRMFVGTSVPDEQLVKELGSEIEFLPLPVGGDDLDAFSTAALVAGGKL